MNVVDSSGWIEYFLNSPMAEFFAPATEDVVNLVVFAHALLLEALRGGKRLDDGSVVVCQQHRVVG